MIARKLACRCQFSVFSPTVTSEVGKLAALSEFTQGKEMLGKLQYRMAELELKRALQILENSGAADDLSFAVASTELAKCLSRQLKHSQAEQTLEEVSQRCSGPLYWPGQRNLLTQYLISSPGKAVATATPLISDTRLSEEQQAEARFLAGPSIDTADSVLLPFIEHNLACAYWWGGSAYPPSSVPLQATSSEFAHAVASFQSAVSHFEGVSPLTAESQLTGRSLHAGLSLTTLASVYLSCDTFPEASKWLKVSLKFHQKYAPKDIARTLVLLAGLLLREKNVLHAEGMLKFALDLLSGVIQRQKSDITEAAALNTFAKLLEVMPKRETERLDALMKAKEIEDRLTPWAEIAGHLQLPELVSI